MGATMTSAASAEQFSIAEAASERSGSSEAMLKLENQALRNALTDAVSRLSKLEGDQERFMSEGIFDLVNALSRSQGDDCLSSSCAIAACQSQDDEEEKGGSPRKSTPSLNS